MDTAAGQRPSLLLVEENHSIMAPLRDWLSMVFPSIRLIEATDQAEGISLNRSQRPDVVLMDISTLGRRGVDRVHSMKAVRPAGAVLALVTLESEVLQRELLRAGAEGCTSLSQLRTEMLPLLKKHLGTEAETVPAVAGS